MKPNRLRRLTPEQKVQLVSDYVAKIPIKDIAEKFGVHRSSVHRILNESTENYE